MLEFYLSAVSRIINLEISRKFSLTILTILGAILSCWIKQIFKIIYRGRPSEAGDTDIIN